MDRGVKVGLPRCVTSDPTCRPVQVAPRFSSCDSWDRLVGRADHGSISPPASRNYLRRLGYVPSEEPPQSWTWNVFSCNSWTVVFNCDQQVAPKPQLNIRPAAFNFLITQYWKISTEDSRVHSCWTAAHHLWFSQEVKAQIVEFSKSEYTFYGP